MVPECDRVFVAGDVKRPGAFPFLSVEDTTVLQMFALSVALNHSAATRPTSTGRSRGIQRRGK
jgi:protein involved in polysaccharide export with SLBB domain